MIVNRHHCLLLDRTFIAKYAYHITYMIEQYIINTVKVSSVGLNFGLGLEYFPPAFSFPFRFFFIVGYHCFETMLIVSYMYIHIHCVQSILYIYIIGYINIFKVMGWGYVKLD